MSRRLRHAGEIRVAVIGRAAVLRGRVPFAATKEAAERLVGADEAVTRVVNKLQVSN